MPLIYTLVKRKDMSKDAASGATLYHAQTSITKKLTLNKICTRIENICTASRGEIILVLDQSHERSPFRRRIGSLGRIRQLPYGCRQQRFGHRRRFHHRPVQPCPHRLLPRHDADQPRQQRLLRTLRPEKGRLQRIGRQWRWHG